MVESIDLPSLKRNNVEYWKRKQSKNVVDKNIKKKPHITYCPLNIRMELERQTRVRRIRNKVSWPGRESPRHGT